MLELLLVLLFLALVLDIWLRYAVALQKLPSPSCFFLHTAGCELGSHRRVVWQNAERVGVR